MRITPFALILTFLVAASTCLTQTLRAASPVTGPARGSDGKRPMTFGDMMKMKRLGEGLSKAKAGLKGVDRAMKVIGLGMYDSGIPDLASNKKYTEGFGQKRMGRKPQKPEVES
jgi:hypothetical protein